jgi:acylphosphatase
MRGAIRADAMIARRVVVSGRVQGVGYRYAMTDAARAIGVAGWVRNRRDGTVEALVQGEDEQVERMLTWCQRGPPGARVTAIATDIVNVDAAIEDFAPRPTE